MDSRFENILKIHIFYLKPSSTIFSSLTRSALSAAPISSQLFEQGDPPTIAHSSEPSQQSQMPSFTLEEARFEGLNPRFGQ